jgi:hypothetical protein
MASLASLQGTGGGRIPMGGFSYDVSRHDLTRIIDSMPTQACREMHLAVCWGDTVTAQRLLREAAAIYFASTPAAPAVAAVAPRHSARRAPRTPARYRSQNPTR